MHSFRDRDGRVWELVGNFFNYSRVKDRTGVDLFSIGAPGQTCLDQLADLYTLGNVLWALCERQAREIGVSEEQFGESLCGDEIDAAHTALVNEAIFFSRRDRRELLQMAMKKVTSRQMEMEQAKEALMKEAGEAMDRAIDELIHSSSGMSSQESSAFIPATGHSANCGGRQGGNSETTGTTQAD